MAKLFLEYLARYRGRVALGALSTALAAGFGLLTPYLLREAIDTFSGVPSALGWPLAAYALAIILVAGLEAAFRFSSRMLITGASRWIEYDLRNRFFAHLESLDAGFYLHHRTGDLVARATNDLSAVRQLYGPALHNTLNTLMLIVGTLVLMFQISRPLALGAGLLLPAAVTVFMLSRARMERSFTKVQEQFAAMADHSQETFAGQRVVKAYAQEAAESETFRRTSAEYVARQLAQTRLVAMLWPAMTLVTGLLVVMLLYVGGRDVVEGRLTLGEFVQFSAYVGMLNWPMMALGWVSTLFQQGTASLRRIQAVLATRPTIRSAPGMSPRPIRARIEFRNVSLTLGGREVLTEVNLTIPAGATFAIVGPLGSGKSSLVNLIPRLHDATTGQVLVDGVDVRELSLPDLRRQIGYVPQETFLFSGSVRENVAFGLSEDEASAERVNAAVHLSRLENDLDQWPRGLATIVGERGVTLSGGQKQRTSIARAVARDPAILVLDDALSSVDARTEEAILDGLREFMAQRTSIIIAHRVSTVRSADQIAVLREGRIVEQGTHSELVQRNGIYTRMYHRQLIAQELGVEDDSASPPPGSTETSIRPAVRAGRANSPGWEGI